MNSKIVTFARPLSNGMSFARPLSKIVTFACPLTKKNIYFLKFKTHSATLSGGMSYLIFFLCSARRVFGLSKLNILYVIEI